MKIKRVFDNILFRRFLYSILVLFGLSILIFTLARLLPGDPARLALGPRAPEDVVQRYREQLHLDQPIYIQYFYWLNDVIHFSLGQSLVTFRDVSDDIREFLPATLELILFSGIILVIGALILGVISGRRPGSIVDNAMRLFAYVGISIPSFVWAIIFQLVFAYWLNLLPAVGRISDNVIPPPRVTGFMTIDSLLAGNLPAFIDSIKHLILPATALAIGPIAQDARILRANLIENIGKDYVLNFKSHGIPETTIYFKYALKPSLIPVIAVMGLDIASLLGNAFLVELIFNWPGLSRYGINAMLRKDLNAIVGVTLVIGVIFIIANLIVDLIIYYLDPRIKYREKS
ncbi:MAG: ABC transporter permease [Thermoproteota archaeon]|jgi:peptide/nickel transport system permease protein|nr:ABC transporter permease [Thermoproteota archaeon]